MASNQDPIGMAELFLAKGQKEEAVRLIAAECVKGNRDALFTFACWLLIGAPVERDLPKARDMLRVAAEGGHSGAALMEVALTANGSGGSANWHQAKSLLVKAAKYNSLAASHLALLQAMDLDEEGRPNQLPKAEVLSTKPHIVRYRNLVSLKERLHLAQAAEALLEASTIFDPSTGGRIPHPIRTSQGAVIGPAREDLVVRALNLRFAAISGTDVAQGEPLSVLRYAPGQQYRSHLDYISGASNQRIKTVLIYLNDGYQGGETMFEAIDLKIKGQAGDAVVFDNILPNGQADMLSRHAGLPVYQGVKWLATRWIRSGPYDPWSSTE